MILILIVALRSERAVGFGLGVRIRHHSSTRLTKRSLGDHSVITRSSLGGHRVTTEQPPSIDRVISGKARCSDAEAEGSGSGSTRRPVNSRQAKPSSLRPLARIAQGTPGQASAIALVSPADHCVESHFQP